MWNGFGTHLERALLILSHNWFCSRSFDMYIFLLLFHCSHEFSRLSALKNGAQAAKPMTTLTDKSSNKDNTNNHWPITPYIAAMSFLSSSDARFCLKLLIFTLTLVVYHNSVCAWNKLPRTAILPPHLSAWCHLMEHGDASSFLLLTGLTRKAFSMLHDILKPPGHPALPKERA